MNLTSRFLRSTATTGVALLVAGLALTGCGNASAPVVGATPSITESAPASTEQTTQQQTDQQTTQQQTTQQQTTQQQTSTAPTSSAKTHTVQSGAHSVTLPEGITLPDGAVVNVAVPGQVALSAPEAAAVIAHYRQQLSTNGYTVTSDLGSVLHWQGNGWEGTVSNTVLQFWEFDADTDEEGVDPDDLGITGAPFHFELPAGTAITNLTNSATGSSFTITTPESAKVYAFTKANVLSLVFFTINSDNVVDGNGELRFHDEEYDGVMTFQNRQVQVVFTQR